jgi:transcriptional regulator with XRE-family HTH domain
MATRNSLLAMPPHPVEQALKRVGANLRVARLRRGLTLRQAGEKVGAGVRAVSDAEKGKPSTGVAVYAALLWSMGLLADFEALASPERDPEGEALARAHERRRARPSRGLDNDF